MLNAFILALKINYHFLSEMSVLAVLKR